MKRIQRLTYSAVATLALATSAFACNSTDTEDDAATTGGASTTGGMTSQSGGRTSSGGNKASGGSSTSSGGKSSSGGAASGGDTAVGGEGGGATECQSIVEIAASTPDFSILVAAVTKAGLVDALGGEGLTVFAPTNQAFADLLEAIGAEGLDDLSVEQLTPILTYHVLGSVVDSGAAISVAEEGGKVPSLGGTIALSLKDGDLILDAEESAATVTATDIEACNGVIHVLDGVILPSILDVVATQPQFSGLLTLVGASSDPEGLSAALDGPAKAVDASLDPGGFTLFAPANEAISSLPAVPPADAITDILKYHVYAADNAVLAATALTLDEAKIPMLNGDELTVDGGTGVTLTDAQGNESSVITTDVLTSNGVIHRIDGVLLP